LLRAITLFPRPRIWRSMIKVAMQHDFSWENSANTYIELYHHIKK